MKINPDCVRDVMLALEEQLDLKECGFFVRFVCSGPDKLLKSTYIKGKGYSMQDIYYSCLQCAENGYIVADYDIQKNDKSLSFNAILYITPKGHDFIASIADQKTWQEKIKPAISAFGNVSLSVIESISKGIVTALIENPRYGL